MDRQVLGLLKNTLLSNMHWDDNDYANLVIQILSPRPEPAHLDV
jgi:hypothetical protein